MSGTESTNSAEEVLSKLECILDRQSPLDALAALHDCLVRRPGAVMSLGDVALGLDANVLLKVNNRSDRSDVVDYLAKHPAPVVVPGQAVQEFWNNSYNGITTLDRVIKQRYDSLEREMQNAGLEFSDFKSKFEGVLSEFQASFGYVYDKSTKRNIENTVDILRQVAYSEFVPRGRFSKIAADRKLAKTPPGFKDSGSGDFYIWADFLYSLLLNRSTKKSFGGVVFVTDDVKSDWSTRGTPHPILRAEVKALLGLDFDIWTLEELAQRVRSAT